MLCRTFLSLGPWTLSQITFEICRRLCCLLWEGASSPTLHWTPSDEGLRIFLSTAETSYYISHVVAYSDKPERVLWASFILHPSEVQFQHLRTSTDKTQRRSYQLVTMNFPSRLSPPRPGVPAGRRQPAPSFFLRAKWAGSSQGEAEYPGRSTPRSKMNPVALNSQCNRGSTKMNLETLWFWTWNLFVWTVCKNQTTQKINLLSWPFGWNHAILAFRCKKEYSVLQLQETAAVSQITLCSTT